MKDFDLKAFMKCKKRNTSCKLILTNTSLKYRNLCNRKTKKVWGPRWFKKIRRRKKL